MQIMTAAIHRSEATRRTNSGIKNPAWKYSLCDSSGNPFTESGPTVTATIQRSERTRNTNGGIRNRRELWSKTFNWKDYPIFHWFIKRKKSYKSTRIWSFITNENFMKTQIIKTTTSFISVLFLPCCHKWITKVFYILKSFFKSVREKTFMLLSLFKHSFWDTSRLNIQLFLNILQYWIFLKPRIVFNPWIPKSEHFVIVSCPIYFKYYGKTGKRSYRIHIIII